MAAGIVSEASPTLVISTPVTLDTINTTGSFILSLDLVNMTDTDTLRITVEKMVRTAGTTRLMYDRTITGAQGELILDTFPVFSANEVVFKIEQTAGTGRVIPWATQEL